MAKSMWNKNFDDFALKAGSGFIMGHGTAMIGSLYHSFTSAPAGSRIRDFASHYQRSAFQNGTQMATWSIVQALVDPYVEKRISNSWAQSIVSGAATGAITECRNGLVAAATGAMQGAFQSGFFGLLSKSIAMAAKPVGEWRMERKLRIFKEDRTKIISQTPISVITSAFFTKK